MSLPGADDLLSEPEAARAPLLAANAALSARIAELSGCISDLRALAEKAASPSQPVYRCDFCGSDYTDQTLCCERRREYLSAHEPPSQPVALPDAVVAATKRYAELRDSIGSCSDGCCVVKRPTGMHTNGGCRCPDDRFKARKMMWAGQQLYEAIADAPAGEGMSRG